jgi:hypothetical protein
MTIQSPQSPAGWYSDPSGNPGQKYWDGQNWQLAAVAQPASQDEIRAAMAENRSIWVTNGLACWSLVISVVGFFMNFLFGAGIIFGGFGGIIAFNKSKKTGQGRGLSTTALVLNGLVFAFGLIVIVFLLAAAGSGGGSS